MRKNTTVAKKKKQGKVQAIPARVWKNVARGVQFLDIVFGSRKEWLKRMKMTSFDIADARQCVAGNVFSNGMDGYDAFVEAMHLLHLDGTGTRFGFLWEQTGSDEKMAEEQQYLQDAWFHVIAKMKKANHIR